MGTPLTGFPASGGLSLTDLSYWVEDPSGTPVAVKATAEQVYNVLLLPTPAGSAAKIQIPPTVANVLAGTFNVNNQTFANGFGETRNNEVYTIGYNQAPGGAPVLATDTSTVAWFILEPV